MYTLHADSKPLAVAAAVLNSALSHEKGKDILLLLSGGSAIALADTVLPKHLSEKVTVTALDERYTYTPSESNFEILTTMQFWKTATDAGVEFIDPRPLQNETLEVAADRFNTALTSWQQQHPQGVVVATFGIGPDGHVSGVLPFPEDPEYFAKMFVETKQAIVGYSVSSDKNPFTKRLTTTLAYLQENVAHAVFLVNDTKKQEALRQALAPKGDTATTPARVIHAMKNVHLVVPNDMVLD